MPAAVTGNRSKYLQVLPTDAAIGEAIGQGNGAPPP
jgi:hypothetical protein